MHSQEQYNTIPYSFNGINDKYALFTPSSIINRCYDPMVWVLKW